jgi:hypothetical protein
MLQDQERQSDDKDLVLMGPDQARQLTDRIKASADQLSLDFSWVGQE